MSKSLGRYEEHRFGKVISGDPESARRTICSALEELGYSVINDAPVQAMRKRRKSIWRANILEVQTSLMIALKPISSVATLATFNYEVEYLFTAGDRAALEREADAIIAIADRPAAPATCPVCGSDNEASSRFCRICGTSVAGQTKLAELGLMRATAEASTAHIEIVTALILQLLTVAISFSMIYWGSLHVINAASWVFGAGQLLVFLIMLQAIARLRRTGTTEPQVNTSAAPTRVRPASRQEALPPNPFSVTEGTTELIDSADASLPMRPAKTTDSM